MKLNKRDSTAGVTVTLFNVRFGWPEMVRRTSQWSWMISHRIVARLKENTSFFAFSCTVFRLLWAAFPFRKMTPKSSQTAQSPALAMVMFLCLCRDLDSLGAFFFLQKMPSTPVCPTRQVAPQQIVDVPMPGASPSISKELAEARHGGDLHGAGLRTLAGGVRLTSMFFSFLKK